jgi:hypothetical protein
MYIKETTQMIIHKEMSQMSECISMEFENEVDGESIKNWFTKKGVNYDADTGVLSDGNNEAYMTIYSKVGNIFFREWEQEFPDFVFEFVFAHPCKVLSLLSVDDRGYPDPDTASQFTHEEFCTLLATDGGDE